MAINIDRINTFEEKTQLYFYKVLHNLAGDPFSQFEAREKELIGKNRNLTEDIFSARTRDKTDYQRLKMVRGIIKKVPRLPMFIHSLVSKIMDDRVSPNEIAEHVKEDPSLMGIVLKTVNSSYYGFQKKISDISHAIVLIGLNGMFQLITAEGARRSMPDTPGFHELHFHSVAVSHFAFELSQNLQLGKPSQIATIGMVHDLGQVVIQLLKEQNPNLAILIDALNSAQMGSLLLKEWNLPDVVWKSVEFQRYPEFSPPDNVPDKIRNMVVILYLAHLCYGFFQNKTEDELPTTFLDEYKRFLNRETFSVANFALKCVLPGLIKKFDTLPISLRQLLEEYK
jgi:HD-like signal output (HDOD) protein